MTAARQRPSGHLAVIPARGGSKRLPGKNVREFHGRPAIAHTIDAALGSGLFDRVVVSTDSAEIAEIARRHGAEVPFVRDAGLADDHTPVSLVTLDALDRLDPCGRAVHAVAQLMANCPLRTADDVRRSHGQFAASGAPSQVSVVRFGWLNPWWAVRRTPELALEPLFAEARAARSQDLPDVFCPTGAVWWARASVLRQERTFHGAGCTGWEIPWHRGVDVDTEDDWQMAEALWHRDHAVDGAANDGAVADGAVARGWPS